MCAVVRCWCDCGWDFPGSVFCEECARWRVASAEVYRWYFGLAVEPGVAAGCAFPAGVFGAEYRVAAGKSMTGGVRCRVLRVGQLARQARDADLVGAAVLVCRRVWAAADWR